ncbi:MAG: hypothetical protein NT154_09635 [Verrucomicrobia bacterium]|nr:hypothetical protein [Verrucomicrobiota bacterium]
MWGPFKSRAEADADRRVRLHQGKASVKDYLKHVQVASGRYREMAKRALALGEKALAQQYAAIHLQYENQGRRWQAFLLKLTDVELRGSAFKAMGDLVGGLDALAQNINQGISLPAMEKTMVQLQTGMLKVDQVEEQMSSHMENLAVQVGPESLTAPEGGVPEELKGEVERLCGALMDEVAVESKAGVKNATAGVLAAQSALAPDIEARMAQQVERLRGLRPADGKK